MSRLQNYVLISEIIMWRISCRWTGKDVLLYLAHGVYEDIAFIGCLSGIGHYLDFRGYFFKALWWIWVRFFWMKISKSPTRSRSSDEVLLIQGTNVSDIRYPPHLCGRKRMIDCRIRCFRSLLSILDIQILGLEMICSLQRVEFAVEIFVEFSALIEMKFRSQ